ncbi:RNase H family protein [Vibrio hangzhouensis]|uniref:ribonuclease H n=1 Tax=Vibrio hangzhouensis TaxID=462991 RepID=A0A1H6AD65_9VIBR|nr:RNase H family protein [Vibrio hangzhouensis]SEG46658.1 ribonuclease HI [Vibrio hangzhouensis]
MNNQNTNNLTNAVRPLKLFCDGAAPDNQNGCKRGGVGVVAYDTHGRTVYEYSKPIIEQGGTTNSKTELYALAHALTLSSGLDSIHCDNKYVVDGYNMWLDGWKEKGWRKADKKPVAHSDLWRHIAELKAARPDVQVIHVKGHAGIKGNEHADELASKAARG